MLDFIRERLSALYPIPEEEWNAFTELLHLKKIKKDEYFVTSGEHTSDFAFIESGMVRYVITTFEGNEFNQTFKGEKEFIMNYYAVLKDVPSPFSIQALEDTTLVVGDYKKFLHFYERHSCWNAIGRQIAEINFLQKSWREKQLLMHDAKDRYLNLKEEMPHLMDRIPQYHVALYLGINPATLNRLIKKIEKEQAEGA